MSSLSIFPNAKLSGEAVPEITSEELFESRKAHPEVKMIDVRRPDEFTGELGHIEGASLCTLETDLQNSLSALSPNDTYVFVCRSGGRSARATAYAMSLGMKNVFNMAGGMIDWNEKKLPTSK